MKKRPLLSLLLLSMLLTGPVRAQNAPQPRHMMAWGYYLREPTDRAWSVKLVGTVPSMPGMYVIIHDTAGKKMFAGHVAHGTYTADKPFTINFPADGATGDYKLYIAGQQNDYLGLDLPLSDLPFEVYGGGYYSMAHSKEPVHFIVKSGVTRLAMRAWGGYLKITNDKEETVADFRAGVNKMVPGESNKDYYGERYNPIEFPVELGKVYTLRLEGMYFESREPMFFAFDPKRLFEPDIAKLDAVKWWEMVD